MEILKALFFKKRSSKKYRKSILYKIRKYLAEYSKKQISIIDCVSNTAPLTAELVFMYSSERTKSIMYESVLIMITNYYVMLYMDMYTGFYAVSRKHTNNLVSTLVDEILQQTVKSQNGFISNNPDLKIQNSCDFTREMVEVYYRAGVEGCHRYLTSSVYSALLYKNKNLSVMRDWVEHMVREIQAEKFLVDSFEDEGFSLEHTG